MSRLIAGVLLGLISCSGAFAQSSAATRVVQFSGVASSDAIRPEIIELNTVGSCYVSIVNAGGTDQFIEAIEFLAVTTEGELPRTEAAWSPPDAEQFVTPTSDSDSCTSTDLPPRGVCLARFSTLTIAVEGARLMPCAGRITVRDSNPAAPGSVIAAGGISVFQESQDLESPESPPVVGAVSPQPPSGLLAPPAGRGLGPRPGPNPLPPRAPPFRSVCPSPCPAPSSASTVGSSVPFSINGGSPF